MDTKQIVGGDWEREIKRGLRHSNLFLACLSSNTAQFGDVLRFEYESALEIQRERLEGEIFIVPVRLEPREIPEIFSKLQTVDLYDPKGRQSPPGGDIEVFSVSLAASGSINARSCGARC